MTTQRRTTTQRGYNYAHKQRRAHEANTVKTGHATCWRCGRGIHPNEPWDLGHDDRDRTKYRGPEHVRCNRAAPNRRRNERVIRRAVAATMARYVTVQQDVSLELATTADGWTMAVKRISGELFTQAGRNAGVAYSTGIPAT